jgi:hypothetical protein
MTLAMKPEVPTVVGADDHAIYNLIHLPVIRFPHPGTVL